MKAIKVLILVVVTLLMSSNYMLAGNGDGDGEKSHKALVKEKIYKLINNTDMSAVAENRSEAIIEFIITNENKVVVLSVDTQSNYLESTLKSKLNYKKIDVVGSKHNTPYRLKVTFLNK